MQLLVDLSHAKDSHVKPDELQADILAFLEDELRIDTSDIQPDTGLVSGGIVDSTDLVRLATRLERKLGIEIPDRDISADNLDSIEMISNYVSSKLGG
jgi:acyl carrier protein